MNLIPVDLANVTFCLGGKALFTADFRLVSADTGQVIHDFSEHLPETAREQFGEKPESRLKLTQEQKAALASEVVHMIQEGASKDDTMDLAFRKVVDYWKKKLEDSEPPA